MQRKLPSNKANPAVEALKENASVVARVLNTEDGKRMLDILKQAYDQNIFSSDPHETAYRLGGFDLYRYLVRMQEYNEQLD